MTLIALMTESLLIAEHQQVISQAQLWLQTYLTALRHARATSSHYLISKTIVSEGFYFILFSLSNDKTRLVNSQCCDTDGWASGL